jgi:hypothetical protein
MSKATLLVLMFLSYAIADPKGVGDALSTYVQAIGGELKSALDINRIFPELFTRSR